MPSTGIVTATRKNGLGETLTPLPITWASSDPSVATVAGISLTQAQVTAVSAGTTDITATEDGIESNVCTVTVTGP